MRKSQTITLTLLTAIAAMACDENIKHCVDLNGVVQDETHCTTITDDGGVVQDETHGNTTDGGGVTHVPRPGFRWYYGGYSTRQSPGTKVTGGSYTPSSGVEYSTPSISRGGFGGTGESFGGGGGG